MRAKHQVGGGCDARPHAGEVVSRDLPYSARVQDRRDGCLERAAALHCGFPDINPIHAFQDEQAGRRVPMQHFSVTDGIEVPFAILSSLTTLYARVRRTSPVAHSTDGHGRRDGRGSSTVAGGDVTARAKRSGVPGGKRSRRPSRAAATVDSQTRTFPCQAPPTVQPAILKIWVLQK